MSCRRTVRAAEAIGVFPQRDAVPVVLEIVAVISGVDVFLPRAGRRRIRRCRSRRSWERIAARRRTRRPVDDALRLNVLLRIMKL